jgi:hypothetical protein
MIQKVIDNIRNRLLFPYANLIVNSKSVYSSVKSVGNKPKITVNTKYEGQPILLIALFQKADLRPDLISMLEIAKKQGFYILGVNTLRLKSLHVSFFDTYIERANFGRDFGSYKCGFLHIFKNKWESACPRLLMVNDSVFYSQTGLEKFLHDMKTSTIEVLGATENFEIEHHLGSFCISYSDKILNSSKFQKYWRQYKLSDVRPKVIKRGEMALSKTLKKCVSTPSSFSSLYSWAYFADKARSDPFVLEAFVKHHRVSQLVDWPRFQRDDFARSVAEFMPRKQDFSGIKPRQKIDLGKFTEKAFIFEYSNLVEYFCADLKAEEAAQATSFLNTRVTAEAIEVFRHGSHIHQNQTVLYALGLPIIKMDLIYRGMFNTVDLENLNSYVPREECDQVFKALAARPFGSDVMIGWKRAAFMRGLI